MKKALTCGLYGCLFVLTSVTLYIVSSVIWGDPSMSSCREMMLGELDMGWEHLCDTLPYWGGRFDDTDSHLKGQKMIEQLPMVVRDTQLCGMQILNVSQIQSHITEIETDVV